MLVSFEVGNYRSFRDIVKLSLRASYDKALEASNVTKVGDLRILNAVVIYGQNSSGKSNLLRAINFVRFFVINSSSARKSHNSIPVEQFSFDKKIVNEPSHFQIEFCLNNYLYLYGFDVDNRAIHREWLTVKSLKPKSKPLDLFIRQKDKVVLHRRFTEGKGLIEKTREDSLFLSVVAQFNGKTSKEIVEWFENDLLVNNGLVEGAFYNKTLHFLEKYNFKDEISNFLKKMDTSVGGISYKKVKSPDDTSIEDFYESEKGSFYSEKGKEVMFIYTAHKMFDGDKYLSSTRLPFIDESEGTKRLFNLSVPIIMALKHNQCLVIDELDSRLHPLILRRIIHFFNAPSKGKYHPQLIFATHNTSVLSSDLFRRDQVYITEKNLHESTVLNTLMDYKENKPRKDSSFEKNYLLGKYGGVPFPEDLDT